MFTVRELLESSVQHEGGRIVSRRLPGLELADRFEAEAKKSDEILTGLVGAWQPLRLLVGEQGCWYWE